MRHFPGLFPQLLWKSVLLPNAADDERMNVHAVATKCTTVQRIAASSFWDSGETSAYPDFVPAGNAICCQLNDYSRGSAWRSLCQAVPRPVRERSLAGREPPDYCARNAPIVSRPVVRDTVTPSRVAVTATLYSTHCPATIVS